MAPTHWLVIGGSGALLFHTDKKTRGLEPECYAAGMTNVQEECHHGLEIKKMIQIMAACCIREDKNIEEQIGCSVSDEPLPLNYGLMIFWNFNDFPTITTASRQIGTCP